MKYFNENCRDCLVEGTDYWQEDDRTVVVDKSLEKLLKPSLENLKSYINQPEFLDKFNEATIDRNMTESVGSYDVNKWSFESCAFYSTNHELAGIDLEEYNISHFSDLPVDPVFIERSYGKRSWKQFELSAICGTVIARTDSHHLVTILTPDNEVVNVKMSEGSFAWYKRQISEINPDGSKTVVEKSWLNRGSLLICCGYRRGEDDFVCKTYKNSIFNHQLMKIVSVNDGKLDIQSERWNEENSDEN